MLYCNTSQPLLSRTDRLGTLRISFFDRAISFLYIRARARETIFIARDFEPRELRTNVRTYALKSFYFFFFKRRRVFVLSERKRAAFAFISTMQNRAMSPATMRFSKNKATIRDVMTFLRARPEIFAIPLERRAESREEGKSAYPCVEKKSRGEFPTISHVFFPPS